MVARPSGSLVSFTWYFDSTQRDHFCLDPFGIAAGHGVVFEAALAALGVAAAIADGDRDHDRNPALGNQIIQRGEKHDQGRLRRR